MYVRMESQKIEISIELIKKKEEYSKFEHRSFNQNRNWMSHWYMDSIGCECDSEQTLLSRCYQRLEC